MLSLAFIDLPWKIYEMSMMGWVLLASPSLLNFLSSNFISSFKGINQNLYINQYSVLTASFFTQIWQGMEYIFYVTKEVLIGIIQKINKFQNINR